MSSKAHNRIQLLFWLQDIKSLKKNKDGLNSIQRQKLWYSEHIKKN